jgi:hypothetical protein
MPLDYNVPSGTAFDGHTISSTALALSGTGLTAAQVVAASRAIIAVRSGAINTRWDGTDPTTSAGIKWGVGERFQINGSENLANFRMIRDGATDATVDIMLEG